MTAFLHLVCALTQIHVTLSLYCADGVTECELWRDTLDNRNAMTDNGGVGSACGFPVINPCPCFGLGLTCGFVGNDCCSKMDGGSQLWLTDARSTLGYNHITFGIWLNLGSLGNDDYFNFYYSINDSLNWVEFASVNYAWTDNYFEQELPQSAWNNDGGVRIMFEMIAGGSDTAYLQSAQLKGFLMTQTPTEHPTTPTYIPTLSPTQSTHYPTTVPTVTPTMEPTVLPTKDPTAEPTAFPTKDPLSDGAYNPHSTKSVESDSDEQPFGRFIIDNMLWIVFIIIGLVLMGVCIGVYLLVAKRKRSQKQTQTVGGMEMHRITSNEMTGGETHDTIEQPGATTSQTESPLSAISGNSMNSGFKQMKDEPHPPCANVIMIERDSEDDNDANELYGAQIVMSDTTNGKTNDGVIEMMQNIGHDDKNESMYDMNVPLDALSIATKSTNTANLEDNEIEYDANTSSNGNI